MALSQKKIDSILADFHTGQYSGRALAKNHSVGVATVARLIKGLTPKNETLVNELADTTIKENQLLEQFGTLGTPEKKSVSKEVDRKVLLGSRLSELLEKTLDGVETLLDGKITYTNTKDGVQAIPLQASDYKQIVDTIDKASVTTGENPRFSNQAINVNTQLNTVSADEASEVEVSATLSAVMQEAPETSEQAQIRYDNAMKKRRGEIK